MELSFDHVVIAVPSLAEAVGAYEAAGFQVLPGGRHDVIPTENALIAFEDGTYLELLALRDDDARESLKLRAARPDWAAELRRGSAVGRRVFPRLTGAPGVADFVLGVRGLERLASEARRRGFAMTGPTTMSRERKDGVKLEWALALPESHALPFFIEDRTPRALRVPGGEQARHPNGATGVSAVRVRATDVPHAALVYAELFDLAPRALPDGRAQLTVAGVRIVLEPGEPEGASGVRLRGASEATAALHAHGVTIELEPVA